MTRIAALALAFVSLGACGGGGGSGEPLDCPAPDLTRRVLRSFGDYYVEHEVGSAGIFVTGYAMRTLLACYDALVDPRYLERAIVWADEFVARQLPTGYWTTGYSRHAYLADTGSALGALFLLRSRVDLGRRERYDAVIERYVQAIERDALILPSGAFGTGWRFDPAVDALVLYPDEYTISSSLTGAQVFSWMYVETGEVRYLEIAHRALDWVLDTVRDDGVVPYVLAGEGADLARDDEPAHRRKLWDTWRFNTAGYVGEGIIAFHTHCDRERWRRSVEERVRPIVDMIVRTQNPDGSWSESGSDDQKRSPGVVNLLVWYHTRVKARKDVEAAICRFASLLHDAAAARELGMQNAGAQVNHANAIITALSGRALGAIVVPGADTRW